jgi:hypothetical protein
MSLRGFPYLGLLIVPLLLAASASAGVTLPAVNFTCGIYAGTGPPGFSQLTDCTSSAAATQLAAPSAPGITGVSFGTTSDIDWTLAGQLNGGFNDYPANTSPQSTLQTLVMQTSGPIVGTSPGAQFIGVMPINYSFSITPGPISCITTNPCDFSGVSVQWSLMFLLQGHGVSNPDGERGTASGTGTGSFSGSLSVPAPPIGCCVIGPTSMTITQNADVNTVAVYLGLYVTLPEDVAATFSIDVPQAGSFDFQSEENAPEPSTLGLLAAGLLLFGYRRRQSRRFRGQA